MAKRALVLLAAVIIPVLPASGCSGRAKTVSGAKPAEVTVAAASDLKTALPKIIDVFEKKTSVKVAATFGSSGLLAAQIENGAPIDLFLSANREFVEKLLAKKMLTHQRLYARGLIVLVGAAESLDKLAAPGIATVAMANPEHAPYGRAAKEALEEKGLWAAVEPKIVYAENVAQALEFVKTGNADVAITARSLAKADGLAYGEIDRDLYAPIEQWGASAPAGPNSREAERFLDFLLGTEARSILEDSGFQTVPLSNFIERSPRIKAGEL